MSRFLILGLLGFIPFLDAKEIAWGSPGDLLESSKREGGIWALAEDETKGHVIELTTSDPVRNNPVRMPANMLWVSENLPRPLSFSLNVKSLAPDVKGADVCILFKDESGKHLYYIHLSNDSDGRVHQVIMHVDLDAKTRNTIQHQKRPDPMLKEGWNSIRVTLDRKGILSVYRGDEKTPGMTAFLPSIPVSKLGIGSFNDPARFDL